MKADPLSVSYVFTDDYGSDIALIRLPDEVALRDNAHVACLPESTLESVPDKDKCFAAGWGATGRTSVGSTQV